MESKVENTENTEQKHEIPNTSTLDLSSTVDNNFIMHKPVIEYFNTNFEVLNCLPPMHNEMKTYVLQQEDTKKFLEPEVKKEEKVVVVEEKKCNVDDVAMTTQKCQEQPVSVTDLQVENNENKWKSNYFIKIENDKNLECPIGYADSRYSDVEDIILNFIGFIKSKQPRFDFACELTDKKELLLFRTTKKTIINEFNYEYRKRNNNTLYLKEVDSYSGNVVRKFDSNKTRGTYVPISERYNHRFVSLPNCGGFQVMNNKFEDDGYNVIGDLKSEAEERKQYFLDLSKELNCDNDDHYLLMLYELDEMNFLEWTSSSVRKWLNHSKIWESLKDQRDNRELYELISKRERINRWIKDRLESKTEFDYAKFMILFYGKEVLENFGSCVSKTISFMETDGFERDEDLFTCRKIFAIKNLVELFLGQ